MSRAALLTALLVLPACAPAPPALEGPPLVVVSIAPVADLVGRMAGDAVRIETLLPPRASPDTWEATPSQIRLLAAAQGYVTVGSGLDRWVEDMRSVGAEVASLRLTDGMSLAEHDHEHGDAGPGDPHVWLDPVLVRDRLLPRMEAFLVGVAPGAADGIRTRAAALADSLTRLDAWAARTLDAAPGRAFVATHGAWGYFARRYGLTPLGSVFERPGHEPSARGLARLVDQARAEGIGTVLTEPQLSGTAAEALARELGAAVVVVDPLGGPGLSGRENYFEMMRFNVRAFARALEAS